MRAIALLLLLAACHPAWPGPEGFPVQLGPPRVVCYDPPDWLTRTAEREHDPVPRPTCWRGTRYLGHANGDGTYDNE